MLWIMFSASWQTVAVPLSKPNMVSRCALLGCLAVRNATAAQAHVLRITDLTDAQRSDLALA